MSAAVLRGGLNFAEFLAVPTICAMSRFRAVRIGPHAVVAMVMATATDAAAIGLHRKGLGRFRSLIHPLRESTSLLTKVSMRNGCTASRARARFMTAILTAA